MIWLEATLAVFTAAATVAMAWFSRETHLLARRIQEEAAERAQRRARACRTEAEYKLRWAAGVLCAAIKDPKGLLIHSAQEFWNPPDEMDVVEAFPEAATADIVRDALNLADQTFTGIRTLATALGVSLSDAEYWSSPLPKHTAFQAQAQEFAKFALPAIEEARMKAGLLSVAEREALSRENLPGDGLFKNEPGPVAPDGTTDDASKV